MPSTTPVSAEFFTRAMFDRVEKRFRTGLRSDLPTGSDAIDIHFSAFLSSEFPAPD
jgi:hypothetical protein